MFDVASPKYLEINSGNLLSASRRHLRRLNTKEATYVLIRYDHDVIAERCLKYLEKFHEQMNGSILGLSLSIDGTEAAKAAQISQKYGEILGGSYPDHFINTTGVSDEDVIITLKIQIC